MREVAERFTDELVRGAQALRVGDPMDWRTEIGPMVSSEQHELVAELVDDAVASGRDAALRRPDRAAGRGPATGTRRRC